MNTKNMNEGVQIILARIASHPEEFIHTYNVNTEYHGRWHNLIDNVNKRVELGNDRILAFLTDEEIKAIYDALREVQRDDFTATIMRRITNSENPYELQEQLRAKLSTYPIGGQIAQPANIAGTAVHPAMNTNTWVTPIISSSTTPVKP